MRPGIPKKRNAFDTINSASNRAAATKAAPAQASPKSIYKPTRTTNSFGAKGSAPVAERGALASAARKKAILNAPSIKYSGSGAQNQVAGKPNLPYRKPGQFSDFRRPGPKAKAANETGSSNAVEGSFRSQGIQPGGNKSQQFQTGSTNVTPYKTGNKNRPPIVSTQAAPARSTQKGSGPSVNRGRTPGGNSGSPAGGIRPPVTVIKGATKPKAPVGKPVAPVAPVKTAPVIKTIVDPPSSNPGTTPVGGSGAPTMPTQPAVDNTDPYELFRKEAQSIYQPQLDYITGVENQSRSNAATADKAVGGMYDGLVKDIRGQQPNIEANYNDSMKQIQGVTDQGKAAINANYDKSRNDQAAVLQRLGIQEAAPQTTQRGTEDQAYYTSGEDRSNNAYQRMLASQRSSAVEFNTSQANVTGQVGADQRAGIQKTLQGILGQLGGKRADTQTGIATQTIGLKKSNDAAQAAKAQSQIDQQIAYDRMDNQRGIAQDQLALESRKVDNSETVARNNNAIAAAKLGIERARSSTDAAFKQKQLDQALTLGQGNLLLGQAKLATQDRQNSAAATAKIAASNQSRKDKYAEQTRNQANLDRTFNAKSAPGQKGWKDGPDPWADASKLANSMPRYSGKPSAVENAVGAIRDVVTGRSKAKGTDKFDTLDNFIRTVLSHNPQSVRARDGSAGDATNLVSLATYLYPRLYKAGKP